MSEKPKETGSLDFINMSQSEIAKQMGNMMQQINPNILKAVKDTSNTKQKADNKVNPMGIAMELLSNKKKLTLILVALGYVVLSGVVANAIWLTQLIRFITKS